MTDNSIQGFQNKLFAVFMTVSPFSLSSLT
jgi:hypothetical protein